ncbi:thioredoxin-like protein HCF164, chloroplastic [Durio zibethinus]|uniref:Thioredoxin-like protein HCF164, chloroplastic n=1 Tax=Durio zibethinus TaxID=66656 RepID=A0A6P5Y5C9_DURZI|nr:thioredoxin-like protein HCF164, chloroplastic [Durio zibethinus]
MARLASNPLTLPTFRPSSNLLSSHRREFASFKPSLVKQSHLPLKQNPPTRKHALAIAKASFHLSSQIKYLICLIISFLEQEKVLVEPDSVKCSTSQATTSSVRGGFSEFPNKNISRRIALGPTLAAASLFLLSRIDFGVSLKDLSAVAVPYEEALSNGKPTVIEFYADWCEVCWELAPDVYKVEQQYRDHANFVMLNVDNTKWEQELDEFGVEVITHFAFLDKDGNKEGHVVGRFPRKYFLENVDALACGEASVPHVHVVGQYSSAESREVHQVADPRSHV